MSTKSFLTIKASTLLIALAFLGLPVVSFAQSAEFQWAININGGIQVNAEEDGDEFLYNLQLYNQSDKIVNEQTNNSGNFSIQNSYLIAGEVYDLNLSLLDEASGDIRATHFEPVAVPKITVDSRCKADFRGGTVDFTVNMTPEMGFFPNLSDPEVTPYESGSKRNAVSGLPYVHDLAEPGWMYRFEISFSDSDLVLNSGDVSRACDEDEEEDEVETTVNFGYEVSGNKVTATVLNPNDDYSYAWDVSNDEEGPDYLGTTLEHSFSGEGDASVRLVASQGDTVVGEKTQSFVVPANFQDSDGDGTPDGGEEDADNPDRDGDGVPDAEDECPDDPTNTCEELTDDFTGAPEGGLVNCTNNCGWVEFVELINKLLRWLIGFATVVATLLFMYAGFLYLTSGGKESQTDQAKAIFTNVAIGFGIILTAWLIISTVVTLLTTDEWRDKNEDLLPIELSHNVYVDKLQ